ncbi:hypothetical protein KAH94_01345 [bacterium]|nr:hypothetical protein [bacterium]
MKNIVNKKITFFLILAGLISSIAPTYLKAQTPLFASWQTKAPTTQEINMALKELKNATKTIKTINVWAIAITTGVGITGIITTGLITAVGIIVSIATAGAASGAAVVASGTAATITAGSGTAASGIVGAITAGLIVAASTGGLAGIPLLTGILVTPVQKLIRAFDTALILKKIKVKYPNLLTTGQTTILGNFNNAIKGAIAKGIIKASRLKQTVNYYIQKIMAQNPQVITRLGGQTKAKPIIKNYLQAYRLLSNTYPLMQTNRKNVRELKKIRDGMPSLRNKAISKIKKLNTEYRILKSEYDKKIILIKRLTPEHQQLVNNLSLEYTAKTKEILGAFK